MKSALDREGDAAVAIMRTRCAADPDLEIACRWVWENACDSISAWEPPGPIRDAQITNKQYRARRHYMIRLAANDDPETAARAALDSVGVYT